MDIEARIRAALLPLAPGRVWSDAAPQSALTPPMSLFMTYVQVGGQGGEEVRHRAVDRLGLDQHRRLGGGHAGAGQRQAKRRQDPSSHSVPRHVTLDRAAAMAAKLR